MRKKIIKKAKRVVVKIGSAVLAGNSASNPVFSRIAKELHEAKKDGRQFVIVSSGAVALGMHGLNLRQRPTSIPERQAVAAVGQGLLMARYDRAFSRCGERVAQVLLTHDDLSSRHRFLNARNTLFQLLSMGIVPVINENDTVAVDEMKFGDNDLLSALATNLIEADLLIILTDINGLFSKDPKSDPLATRVSVVHDIDGIEPVEKTTNALGTGGMASKIEAAKKAAHYGAATVIANGALPGVVKSVLDCEDTGTLILPKEDRLTGKKHWIAFSTRPSGRVFVDDGAREAIALKGKSLLPTGVKTVDGSFQAGEVVHCVDLKGMEFARGVANYSSSEIERIKGLKTRDIEGVLGYKVFDEVIHRDNLVVL
ncbi:MAG: glutamate 5-kinase [Deltaproteobacteria bacterium]